MKSMQHIFATSLFLLTACNYCLGQAVATPEAPIKTSPAENEAQEKKQKADKPKYIRISRDEKDEPIALEIAVARFASHDPDGPYVDLIGAVHVAEPEYYAKLNKMFTEYDAVLYELVAPKGTRVPKGGARATSGVGMMQSGMTKMLELTYQLDRIDYTKRNLVHADISPDEFSTSMKKRGESMSQVFFKMLGRAIAQDADGGKSQETQLDMFSALFSKDRAFALKRTMAKQFEDMEGAMDVFEGPDGSTIVTVRNERTVEVLAKEVKKGCKKLAIFYGAAHMPDMGQRITKKLGWKAKGEPIWMMAWDLRRPEKKNRPEKTWEPKLVGRRIRFTYFPSLRSLFTPTAPFDILCHLLMECQRKRPFTRHR